jgi:6-pyruvoyltetrahydropterin/6-carboxytetrahydropterin synthase
MEIFNRYQLESARRLPKLPADHPCSRVHGHSFQVEIHVSGPLDPDMDWVVDFAELDAAFSPIHAQLDHHYLNDIPGLENPTTERMAQWIWQQLKPRLPGLIKIIIQETQQSGCVYSGE